ncbi:MAG: hypothetical protein KDB22_18040 [Planctomycetales bacterium]|nr:hypothetical protein [Planctomycetales bacterium]MCA9197161.1 hypothetical protein [Planctomycetales bacterium]
MSVQQAQIVATSASLTTLRLQLARPLRTGEAPALRGFFGRQFEDEVLMHNHGPNDQLVYQYPRVQFKVLDRFAYLIGINEGAELLQRLWLDIDQTRIGNEELEVLQSDLQTESSTIEVTDEPLRYRFVTPWLALNQKNFHEYTQSRSQSFRREKLDRTLVGNCLGMCKSLGIHLADRITADCSGLHSIKTTLKGQGMIGFIGTFSINLHLPNHLGLGKSVSRGFGTIERKVS